MMNISRSIPTILRPSETTPTIPYFLSNLDQNLSLVIKSIYCFPATARRSVDGGGHKKSDEDISHVLRTSLQKVLVHFYPFVGRLSIGSDGKLFVRFNGDDGVPFIEATADSSLEQLRDISIQKSEHLLKLVYCPPSQSFLELPLLVVQLTKFKCGGFSIGLVMNHSIVDGASVENFTRAWAETARDLPLSLPAFLDRSILNASQSSDIKFHHPEYADLAPYTMNPSDSFNHLQRRFVFDAAKLSRLKELGSSTGRDRPTTFSSLAGFIWLARTKALKISSVEPVKLLFTVNIRNRVEPPLPPGFFGNGFVLACCLCPAGLLTSRPLNHAVEMVQERIRGATDSFIRSTIDCYELTRARPSLAGTFFISNLTWLTYETMDFGWGPPAQFGLAEMFARELALFRPYGKDGKSISITLALPAPAMLIFEEMMNF